MFLKGNELLTLPPWRRGKPVPVCAAGESPVGDFLRMALGSNPCSPRGRAEFT